MADPYKTLGVAKTATDEEIRKAYRKLAKEYHPDLNPSNKSAEARFKEISAANAILGDPEKRRAYDAGEIDETGAPQAERRYYRDYADAGADAGARYARPEDFEGFGDIGDIFGDFLHRGRAQGRGGGAQFQARGQDLRYTLPVDFLDAVNGAKKRVTMPDGRTLDINIPAGVEEGQTLRLKGQGSPGFGGGPAGDALIDVQVQPHPAFRRDGNDIRSVVPITLHEALSGGSVRVATATGLLSVRVPKHSSSGRILRLRGKGVQRRAKGDHLVELQVAMPPHPDADLESFVAEWEKQHPYNPRGAAEEQR